MIAIEHVAADHQKDETGKMPREKLMRCIEAFVLIQNESKINIARDRLYEDVWRNQGGRKRVRKGKKRCKKCRIRRCKMDTLLHRHFYTKALERRHAFTCFYTQRRLHTDAFTHRSPYTQTLGHNKACTKYGECPSQCYFVLQTLHKHFPVLQLCTKHFPVLLCTTKVAHGTSQYYSVQVYYKACTKMHKVLPSTTLYYKACTKYVPTLGPSAV